MDFILANLPIIICFLLGIGLLVVEVFLPGFGVPGITGIILQVVSVVLTYKNHGPVAALGMTIVVLAVVAIGISISLKSAAHGRLSKSNLILRQEESLEEGYSAVEDMEVFLGKEGLTTSVLRPTGIADFDGVRLNVVSEGGFVANNVPVRIEKVEGTRIVVKPITPDASDVTA